MGKYAYINSQGYILEVTDTNNGLPIIQGISTNEEEIVPNSRLNEDDLTSLENIIKIMDIAKENNLDTKVTSIDITNKNQYSIYIQEEKKRIYILAETKEKAKKICSLLNEKEIINKYEENLNQTIIVKNTESLVTVSVGKLSSGFECFDTNQLVITSQELIEGEKRKTYKEKLENKLNDFVKKTRKTFEKEFFQGRLLQHTGQ